MSYNKISDDILSELTSVLNQIDTEAIDLMISEMNKAKKIYFVGVGRVFLSLQSMAKRLAHLGYEVYVVGQITEPALTREDLLIVGSGSGESLYPLLIAEKANEFGAKIIHIGSNPNSSMKEYSHLFIRIPVQTKLSLEDEIKSIQPMTSLFEQSLLLLGDIICLMIINKKNIVLAELWQFHANLE
ncbi:6-phospho-3-hexuloisomerase [Vagococcus fluvialis]|uniref:Sugar isomerase n=1 Tax=Vagococcus fluvialis TaxID=2738 RepID=A0A369ALX0_9ENTE|nr:6-phospho-3-hexuloisomerase [Vagococcus fluvialis]RCX10389.1 6-phospho-3-hexuloisomerase [Vagococcus fluvialis]RST98653.1 sugar isomerase [Vagococcus fluvialis]